MAVFAMVLVLKGRKEALHGRVIVTVAGVAHAHLTVSFFQQGWIGLGGVLAAMIGVMQQVGRWVSVPGGASRRNTHCAAPQHLAHPDNRELMPVDGHTSVLHPLFREKIWKCFVFTPTN